MRIISLVPSQTELLYDLGLDESVAGITKFCIYPKEWFRSKSRVGGPKSIHIEKIRELKPDLIIANKEENIKEQIEACEEFCNVHVTDVSNYEEALQMIAAVGSLTHRKEKAASIINEIEIAFSQLKRKIPRRVIYLIWKDPLMTIGGDTFINDMIEKIGWVNIYSHERRYPQLTEEELINAKPELLLLSSEPYPFTENHIPYFQRLLPNAKIINVAGEPFCWYGSRMRYAPEYFMDMKV